jgi:hypothetical protein
VKTSDNWMSTLVASTAFKYIVASVAGWLAAKLGLDPTEGAASIAGVISALVSLGMLVWGAYESSKSKVVVNGTRVPVSKMTPTDKATVATIVQNTVAKTP